MDNQLRSEYGTLQDRNHLDPLLGHIIEGIYIYINVGQLEYY